MRVRECDYSILGTQFPFEEKNNLERYVNENERSNRKKCVIRVLMKKGLLENDKNKVF